MTAIKILRKSLQRPLKVLQMNKQNCLEIFVDLVGANEFFNNSFSKHDQLLQARLYTVLIFILNCMVSHGVKQVWDIQTVKPLLNWRFKFQSLHLCCSVSNICCPIMESVEQTNFRYFYT